MLQQHIDDYMKIPKGYQRLEVYNSKLCVMYINYEDL